ncbi:MAG: PrsW family intramembrane metalloprotease [Candidatus Saccharibacteria bacterium]
MSLFLILVLFILVSGGLAWYFIIRDRGEKEPIGALWLAAGLGLFGGVTAAILETLLLPMDSLQPGAPLGGLWIASMGVGIIEEACKFIPLAVVLYKKRYFNEHTDGVIYFAIAGLGFGLPENILYSLQFGAGVGLSRVILTPFFHAATTGLVGYFLAKSKLAGHSWYSSAPWALGAVMVLHGMYDFGLASGVPLLVGLSILITFAVSVSLFIFFSKAIGLDQAAGLSVVGKNSFCRTCGLPNPHHSLYCVRCGNRA